MCSKLTQIRRTLRIRSVLVAVLLVVGTSSAIAALYPHAPSPARAVGIIVQKPARAASGVIGNKSVRVAQEMPPIPRRAA